MNSNGFPAAISGMPEQAGDSGMGAAAAKRQASDGFKVAIRLLRARARNWPNNWVGWASLAPTSRTVIYNVW
jgi:hypothetical protein